MLKVIQHIVMPALGTALLVAMLVALLLEPHPPIETVIDTAERCIVDTAVDEYSAASFGVLLSETYAEPDHTCWQRVQLPSINLPTPVVDLNAPHSLQRAWFRLQMTAPDLPPNSALQIYLPRIVGGTWQAWLNGRALADNRDNWRQMWNDPVSLTIPAAMLGDRELDLRLAVTFHPQLGYTVSRAYASTPEALRPRIAWRNFLQDTIPKASSVVLLALGGMFFIFWLARRQETTHLLLPLAGIAWAVCNLQYVLHRPADDLLHDWYDAIITLSITWVMYLVYLFTLRIEARRSPMLERFLPGFVLFMSLIALPIWPRRVEFDIVFQVCNLVMGLTVTGFIALRAGQSGRIELKAIAITLAVAIACAVHDVALYAQVINPEHVYLLPFNAITVYGAMLFALLRRYVSAINASDAYAMQLQSRLDEQSTELKRQHARLMTIERQQVLDLERQRLMRDMHDGLGSTLMSTLVAVEAGRMPNQDVIQVLRTCIEDLRLVIDSLEPLDHDLELILATLRHRLGKHLESAGLTLHWDIADLPKLAWMESPQALQLMRIVQEALTNTVKHAQARSIHVAARHDLPGEVIELCLRDDGVGFDNSQPLPGRGLKNLRKRAADLGCLLTIDTRIGTGCCIRLTIPVNRS